MACPQCQSDEISPSGVCLICGYSSSPETGTEADPEPGHTGPVEVDYAEGAAEPQEKTEVPPWRQQLSQRLHEIKQKKEMMGAAQPDKKPVLTAVPPAKPAESLTAIQERLKKTPVRKPQMPAVPPPRQKTLEPLPDAPKPSGPQPVQTAGAQEIRSIIDSAVLRQAAPRSSAEPPAPVPFAPITVREPVAAEEREGKWILLSRTLSGLVDLIVVVLCTGALAIAADYFSGIISLDYTSLLVYSLLFLLVFFLYSLFFLFACNQTIGMMITDLRVIGEDDTRPGIGQLLGRCCGFLVSLIFAGIGLLMSLFDKESACFHDRLSGTRIVRI